MFNRCHTVYANLQPTVLYGNKCVVWPNRAEVVRAVVDKGVTVFSGFPPTG